MEIVDLSTLEYYFYGDICVHTIVRRAMTLKLLKNTGQYLHINNEEHRPECINDNYDILYKL
jgi:hypothetical protein